MKAHWNKNNTPQCSENISIEEWLMLDFEVIDTPCASFENEDQFNMILQHPHTRKLLFVHAVDFTLIKNNRL